jgi:Na+/proline symporter
MTTLVLSSLVLLFAFTIYLGVLSGRRLEHAGDFLDGGGSLPPWALIFAGAGILLAGLGLHEHFLLSALYGLQYSHIALGLTLAALCGAMAHKRLWLAARLSGLRSPIEILSSYYGSVALRIVLIGLTLIFAVPVAAHSLALAAELIAAMTGALAREQVIFILALFLFLFSALGGWRGIVYVVAAQSFLVLALILFSGLFMAGGFGSLAVLTSGPSALKGVLADAIPGVMQYSAGIGKDPAVGGVFTTLAIISAGASLIGIVLSPAMGFLTTTARVRSSLAFQQVWMVAGLATGALLLVSPVIGAEIAAADAAGLSAGAPGYLGLIDRLAALDPLAALCFLLVLVVSMQISVALFVGAGANLIASDLVHRYVLPELSGEGRRLAARIVLALLYGAVALLAAFAPLGATILGSVALSLGAQLLPAVIGVGWAPWISRSGVITGLLIGGLVVIFTEPPGLIFFEALFLDLPSGRWPLTIHSTGWGLVFNMAACLLVSLFTRAGPERLHREILHEPLRHIASAGAGSPSMGTAKWSLALIWAFLALGPGAILGNTFFSNPVFTEGKVSLGVPSLWVWQIVFWFVGVLLVWWLAYRGRMSIIEGAVLPRVDLNPPADPLARPRAPQWIALLLARVAER